DAQPLRRGDELLREAVEQFFVDEDATRRHAALAAGLERADDGAGHGQVEPGVLADDDGALAAHLGGDDAVEKVRGNLLDAVADLVTAREQRAVPARGAPQGPARLGGAVYQVDHARWEARLLEQLHHALGDGGRVLRRLEHRRVALDQARP